MKQNGNVLFLILIAVALFAALSYAVTSSTRTSGGDTSKEAASLAAADILNYTSQIENAVLRMRLSGGCSDTAISWENPLLGAGYDFTHTPAVPDTCKIFHPLGGGVAYREDIRWADKALYNPASKGYYSWLTGDLNVQYIGSSAFDLVMYLYPIDKAICNEINKKLGIIYTGDAPLDVSAASAVNFQGIYTNNSDFIGDDPGSVYAGASTACVYSNSGPKYTVYKVLIPR